MTPATAPAAQAEAKGGCPASSTGGHYYVSQGGTWTCTMCGGAQ